MRRGIAIRQIVLTSALALACFAVASARAQQTTNSTGGDEAVIEGRVTDARGGALAGATVTLYAREARTDARLSTRTDEAGRYRFGRLAAPTEYIVEARAEGFARSASQVVRPARGAVVTLDLALDVAALREEVVVTASDTAQPVDEVSKAVTVVGRREIEERDEATLSEALRTVPGLRVQQLGGPGSFTSIKTRGLRNQDTAFLIDGLRFRDVTAVRGDASGFVGDLAVADTARVEILRGSGSSLYGTNAVGGVVNVVTDEGGGPFRG
ncbi:MAG TPA: TonB-dependent receptor plug domain-containing protein, partial [Pyrinomonadaceae bacterium]|nr:TonB-dependent receptor plug domain-containing protein [Pyrinomonadaceae bacterium]